MLRDRVLLAAALSLVVAYFVIRNAVQAILDAYAERRGGAGLYAMSAQRIWTNSSYDVVVL